MVLIGLCVYLPEFSLAVYEGIVGNCVYGELQPEYTVVAIVDKNRCGLLYDGDGDFTECALFTRKRFHLSG